MFRLQTHWLLLSWTWVNAATLPLTVRRLARTYSTHTHTHTQTYYTLKYLHNTMATELQNTFLFYHFLIHRSYYKSICTVPCTIMWTLWKCKYKSFYIYISSTNLVHYFGVINYWRNNMFQLLTHLILLPGPERHLTLDGFLFYIFMI